METQVHPETNVESSIVPKLYFRAFRMCGKAWKQGLKLSLG